MDRAEATGLGVSVAGHAALLTLMWFLVKTATSEPLLPVSMEVSYVDEVGLTNASPNPSPAPSAAPTSPEPAPREEAASAPTPEPAPQPDRTAPPSRPAPPSANRQQGSGSAERNSRSLLGPDLLRGLGSDRNARSTSPPASITGAQLASIQSLIQRQIQPCASRRANLLGDGADRIRVTLNLRLRPDGSLSAAPTLLSGRTIGVDDENRRYVTQVGDLIRAAVRECSPIRGLPDNLYSTPAGGWSNINVNFRFPDR